MSSPSLCLASPNITPFLITVQEAIFLESSEGFCLLRQHLAKDSCYDFCSIHSSDNQEDLQPWIVVRDILHALLAPIVALMDHATQTAQRFTKSQKTEDVEHTFRSRGRNAFVWLQSFLADDQDWCLSKACPGCVVQHALDAEFQIRLLLAACMLSDVRGPGPQKGPSLPSFFFFLRSLQQALHEDELWGAAYYEHAETKAQDLSFGMQDLMRQCEKLEITMTPPTSPEETPIPSFSYFTDRRGSLKTASKTFYPKLSAAPGMPIKRSKMAKVQLKLAKEEAAWLQTLIENAWQVLNTASTEIPGMSTIRRMSLMGNT